MLLVVIVKNPLLNTFRANFDSALKQLEELKVRLGRELANREQAMHQQLAELRTSCNIRLTSVKQQMTDELNTRENKMQKDLDDIKNTLLSVCSEIALENCDSDPIPDGDCLTNVSSTSTIAKPSVILPTCSSSKPSVMLSTCFSSKPSGSGPPFLLPNHDLRIA